MAAVIDAKVKSLHADDNGANITLDVSGNTLKVQVEPSDTKRFYVGQVVNLAITPKRKTRATG